jgi:hypothetical protein
MHLIDYVFVSGESSYRYEFKMSSILSSLGPRNKEGKEL